MFTGKSQLLLPYCRKTMGCKVNVSCNEKYMISIGCFCKSGQMTVCLILLIAVCLFPEKCVIKIRQDVFGKKHPAGRFLKKSVSRRSTIFSNH